MFAVDSTEAVYRFMGIKAQEAMILLMRHHWLFFALVMFVMAWRLIKTGYLLPFRSNQFAFLAPQTRGMSISQLCISLCISLLLLSALRPMRILTIENFAGKSWYQHPVAGKKITEITPKANLLFTYLAGGAEEIAFLSQHFFNDLFTGGNASNESPRWLFRAMIHTSATHVDDPQLLDMIEAYGEGCLEPVLASISPFDFWLKEQEKRNSVIWKKFAELQPFGGDKNCIDLRHDLEVKLWSWASTNSNTASFSELQPDGVSAVLPEAKNYDWVANLFASNALLNHIRISDGDSPNHFTNPKGANFEEGVGIWRSLRKLFSIESWEYFLFGKEHAGDLHATGAAEELTKLLRLASEVKGRIVFYLIAIFPLFLLWAALRGVFGPLFFWSIMYLSIAMWEPLWSLSYHVLLAQMDAEKYLQAVAELKDVISLTAADLLRTRFNRAIEAYVMTQFGIAALVTSFACWMGKGWLQQGSQDGVPGVGLLRKII